MSGCCNIDDKGKSCGSSSVEQVIDLKQHWDNAYLKSPEEKLGWYETDLTPTLNLISKTGLSADSQILNVGAGSTTLIDELLKKGYNNLIATDISEVALNKLSERVGNENVQYIVDDLNAPVGLLNIAPVDLWIDRAVLHFFLKDEEQKIYFDLLKQKVKKDGFVILSEFSLEGATKCSGLPVQNYSTEMLQDRLGDDFELIESFNYTYIQPSGSERPYIYTLFKRIN